MNQKYLKSRLKYNPDTGKFIWRERKIEKPQDKTWNKKHAGNEAGNKRRNGYLGICIDGKEHQCSRLAWLYVYGKLPEKEIDHINGKRYDDRISNLREASRSENASNRSMQSNNSSGYKGVWKRKGLDIWVAQICVKGKRIRLGNYKSPEAAHNAYKNAVNKYHKEFSRV